jgi:hypothetical protein
MWTFTLGGLGVACLPLDPKVVGSRSDGFLRVIKILSMTSFGGEVKQSVPSHRFMACKRTLRSVKEILHRQDSVAMFLVVAAAAAAATAVAVLVLECGLSMSS